MTLHNLDELAQSIESYYFAREVELRAIAAEVFQHPADDIEWAQVLQWTEQITAFIYNGLAQLPPDTLTAEELALQIHLALRELLHDPRYSSSRPPMKTFILKSVRPLVSMAIGSEEWTTMVMAEEMMRMYRSAES